MRDLFILKRFGVSILVMSFGMTNLSLSWATQTIDSSPIVVQPYEDLRSLNQQIMQQDKVNHDQEMAIKGLIDDNKRLAETSQIRQQDATLDQVDATLEKYRDYIEKHRQNGDIFIHGVRISKYYDLIKLTEYVDDMKGVHETLKSENNVIQDKYKVLTDLKNEMEALNEKLKSRTQPLNVETQPVIVSGQPNVKLPPIINKEPVIVKTEIVREKPEIQKVPVPEIREVQIPGKTVVKEVLSPEQGEKIQELTKRLAEMDQKIARFDAILAEKDRKIKDLQSTVEKQDADLKTKDESIRWLNQVIAASKKKAEYYQLTSQENQKSLQQVNAQVQGIKDEFAQRFKAYDQFEGAISSLKNNVSQMGAELKEKRRQVDLLKDELEVKITQLKGDDRLKLGKKLIALQDTQASLLEEENRLRQALDVLDDNHVKDLDGKIRQVLARHQLQAEDWQSRLETFKGQLAVKDQQVESLKADIKARIVQEHNQAVLQDQIRALNLQMQDKEAQISTMRAEIEAGKKTQTEEDVLREQLAQAQSAVDLLKDELTNKIVELKRLTKDIAAYKKRLAYKDSIYNQQLQQVLDAQKDKVKMWAKVADLNTKLHDKESQVAQAEKNLYTTQAKDLDQSVRERKLTNDQVKKYEVKISGLQAATNIQALEIKNLRTELALARAQLAAMPTSDELDFLKTGYTKATIQLKQKDEEIAQIKANAAEYQKEYKAQSMEFQSLKDQLKEAYAKLDERNDDLKYKKLELVRFKEQTAVKEGNMMDQVKALTAKLKTAEKQLKGHAPATVYIEKQAEAPVVLPKDKDALRAKLKEALDKIDAQGRIITVLAQKLQDAGQTVDLNHLPQSKS